MGDLINPAAAHPLSAVRVQQIARRSSAEMCFELQTGRAVTHDWHACLLCANPEREREGTKKEVVEEA